MPSSSSLPRVCIIGDSHLASVRKALDLDLIDLSGLEVEFWGAPGRMFRALRLADGVISGSGKALRSAKTINKRGARASRRAISTFFFSTAPASSLFRFLAGFCTGSMRMVPG